MIRIDEVMNISQIIDNQNFIIKKIYFMKDHYNC